MLSLLDALPISRDVHRRALALVAVAAGPRRRGRHRVAERRGPARYLAAAGAHAGGEGRVVVLAADTGPGDRLHLHAGAGPRPHAAGDAAALRQGGRTAPV